MYSRTAYIGVRMKRYGKLAYIREKKKRCGVPARYEIKNGEVWRASVS